MTSVVHASDVEVYQQGAQFDKRLMLMVDQSRSMGGAGALDLLKDYPICVGGGVTNILGKGGLDLGIQVAGTSDLGQMTANIADLVDRNILQGLLGGTLDPLLSITAAIPNSEYPFQRHYCTVVTTPLVINTLDALLKPLLNMTGLSAQEYIEQTCDLQLNLDLLKPLTSQTTVGLYRCYDKNSRVRMALINTLKGNQKNGITKLPDTTTVGLSVSPYDITKNDRAGSIIIEPKPLNQIYTWAADGITSKTQTHRQHLIDYISSPYMDSKGEFTLQNLAKVVPQLTTGLLTDVVKKIVNILVDPINAVSNLLAFENTNNALNQVLNILGLGGNNPLATTYAETGAYLLGNTTKGTGARQYGKKNYLLKFGSLGIPISYKCVAWKQDGMTCDSWDDIGFLGLGYLDTVGYKQVDANLINLLGILSVGQQEIYYEYNSNVDTTYSGFNDSKLSTKNGNFYITPSDKPQCNANGIIVIAGGVPTIAPTLTDALLQPKGSQPDATKQAVERLMGRSLDQTKPLIIKYKDGGDSIRKEWSFKCDSKELKRTILGQDNTDFATWQCIGAYARDIKALQNNSIRTAVIGIDRSFLQLPVQINGQTDSSDKTGLNQIDAIKGMEDPLLTAFLPKVLRDILGGLGSVLDSLLPNSIIGSGLTNGITSLLDRLLPRNPEDIKNMARWGVVGGGGWYNSASSESIARSITNFHENLGILRRETFLGAPIIPADPLTPYNLNNYVFQNMFIPDDKQTWFGNVKKYMTDTGETVQTKTFQDVWNNNEDIKQTNILTGGVLGKLPIASGRQLYINRACNTKAKKYDVSNAIGAIDNDYYKQLCEGQATDPRRNDLMALLGYDIVTDDQGENPKLKTNINYRKMGMVLHSTPIKITQSATVKDDGSLIRDDYVVFGSVEGLLHVVNADTGLEKLAFLPNEMLENSKQRKAFTGNGLEGHDSFSNMQYGVDGPWTAYTEYVWNRKDNKLTVGKSSDEAICIDKDGVFTGSCGKQYIYGGLRMGGRSYYALELNDLTAPTLKFYIDPASGKVYSKKFPDGKSFDAIKNMGQSWSKPTIAWINWQGKRKLVMFVGGGYDAGGTDGNSNNGGYELANYNQTNKRGAGVYMFNAENGDLLWWANNLATKSNDVSNSALNTNMQFSVVSRINTVDRDGDGLVDHLYFGDLGGQLWRVDINNNVDAKQFASAALLLDLQSNRPADLKDTNVRFYEAPVFSIYGYGSDSLAVLSIASSNRSLPISDKSAGAIFNIFDKDVTQVSFTTRDSYLDNKNLVAYSQLPKWGALTNENKPQYGWYVKLSDQQKVMDETAVINKSLYVSIYDPIAQDGRVANCSIGIQGLSSIRRYCLPYGVCEKQTDLSGMLKLGKGILPVTIGSGSTDSKSTRQLIGGFSKDDRTNAANVLGQNTLRRQIVPLKWYEQSTP